MGLKALNLTPEALFIVLCCRQALKMDAAEAINSLPAQNLDWALIEDMIGLHGLAGFALAAISNSAHPARVPDTLIRRLKEHGLKNAFKNLLYVREFNAIVNACNRQQIRLLPLKGIAFLTSMYAHNTALRSLSDIDILFEKKDIARADHILQSMGYQRKQADDELESRAFHAIYRRRVSGFTVLIEVHWDFDYADSPYAIDIAEMWQRSREVENNSGTYYELAVEDNLILNCFHILRHIPKGPDVRLHLKNFLDIGLLIQHYGESINWATLVQRCHNYNVMRPVGMVLQLVRDLLAVEEIPASIFNELQEQEFQKDFACCAVREYIFNPSKTESKALPFLMVDMATASGLRDKLKILAGAPRVFLSLYRGIYYERYGRSTPRALAHLFLYYARKAAAAVALFLRTPRKTAQLQKKRVVVNRKTQDVINWLQG